MQKSVGLVGCGHISVTHLKAWQKAEGYQVRGVFDLNRELAEKRASEFGIETIYEDFDRVLGECDVVDVCTPPQTHAKIAQAVIEAGRHLLIEKPLVTNLADWEKLSAALDSSKGTITVVHNLKFAHNVQQAKEWVSEGRIGDVIRINRSFLTSPDTDRMLVGDSHWSHRLPGGRWLETLPHEMYLFHYLAGALELANVTALHTAHAPPGAPADELIISMKGERCLATVQYSAHCEVNERAMTIYGTHGVIELDILSDAIALTTTGDTRLQRAVGRPFLGAGRTLVRMVPDRASYLARRVKGETPHAALIAATARYLSGEGEAPTPVDEIDYVVRNCDLIGREIDRQLGRGQD